MAVEYRTEGRVAIITLNRPEARNAVNAAVATGIENAIDAYEADPDLWAAIITANGKAFCAGADLKEIAAGKGASLRTERGGFAGIVARERTKPLIAAVAASALAGGTEIALACDIIIAADDTSFGLPEVKRSLVAAAGGLFRLPRAIGMAPALECILTGDPLPSRRAYELGMVNKICPADAVMDEAMKMADRICANAPLAVQASRTVAVRAFMDDDASLFKLGRDVFGKVAASEDFKEGPRAFIEKRAPNWTGK